MELNEVIKNYLQGAFWAEYGMSIFNCSVTEKELDAAKEYAERMIESRIEQDPTLEIIQKEEYKRQLKFWSDSTVRGFKDALKNRGRLVDRGSTIA